MSRMEAFDNLETALSELYGERLVCAWGSYSNGRSVVCPLPPQPSPLHIGKRSEYENVHQWQHREGEADGHGLQ